MSVKKVVYSTLDTYIHTYIHTYIIYIYTYIHNIYIHIYIHTYIYIYIHTYYTHIHTYTHTYTHIHRVNEKFLLLNMGCGKSTGWYSQTTKANSRLVLTNTFRLYW